MPVEIERLLDALGRAPDHAHVGLTASSTVIQIRSGRIARWIGEHRASANRQTLGFFVFALKDRYGPDITDHLVSSTGIETAILLGRPLRARHVREIVSLASGLQQSVRRPGSSIPPLAASPVRVQTLLAREIDKSLRRGYVSQFDLMGDPACRHPMSEPAFLNIVTIYNETMEDLHGRFPHLADLEPPNLSQTDLSQKPGSVSGDYDFATSTLRFTSLDAAVSEARRAPARAHSRTAPEATGLRGAIIDEYARHLSSPFHSNLTHWRARLIHMLQQQGFVSLNTKLASAPPSSPTLAIEVGTKIREMGLAFHADNSLYDFAAQALSWRMVPGYGESSETPRMPPYLEDWVHDCFPYTREGRIVQQLPN